MQGLTEKVLVKGTPELFTVYPMKYAYDFFYLFCVGYILKYLSHNFSDNGFLLVLHQTIIWTRGGLFAT